MVEVGLMHFPCWDRLFPSKFEEWERPGAVEIPPMRDTVSGINCAMLPRWRTITPPWVRHVVVVCALQRPHLCVPMVSFLGPTN
jgi:hypothetical protein